MKRKNIYLISAVISIALLFTGCTYSGGNDVASEDEVIENAESEVQNTESEVESVEAEEVPSEATITLIPENTNYDDEEEESVINEDASEITEEELDGETLIAASEVTEEDDPMGNEGDEVEVDNIIGGEGNWATATIGVNVRDSHPEGEVIGAIEEGTKIKVLAVEGNWYMINYEGQNAYVYSKYFE